MEFNFQNALLVIPSVFTFFALVGTKKKIAIVFSIVVEIAYAALLSINYGTIVELAVQLQIICFLIMFMWQWYKTKTLDPVPTACIALLMIAISAMKYVAKQTADSDDILLRDALFYFILAVPSMNLGLLSILTRTKNDNNKKEVSDL